MGREARLIVQPWGNRVDPVPDQLTIVAQGDQGYFTSGLTLLVDLPLGVQGNLVFMQRQELPVLLQKRLQLLPRLRYCFDLR